MRILSYLPRRCKWLLAAAALTIVPTIFWADNDNTRGTRPFDFSDVFYFQHGINPAAILNRVNGTRPPSDMPSCSIVDNSNTDPDRRNIRVRSTTGGFDHEGNPLYYDINGMVMPSTFSAYIFVATVSIRKVTPGINPPFFDILQACGEIKVNPD